MNTKRARELRKNLTDAEQHLWRILKRHQVAGVKFRRQQPIGSFIVDFVCFERRLIVEVDGGQHAEQVPYDEQRTGWLEAQGSRLLRLKILEQRCFGQCRGCGRGYRQCRRAAFPTPHLNPPPQGGRKLLTLSSADRCA
jgi:very-short-patch-repair endonuclease